LHVDAVRAYENGLLAPQKPFVPGLTYEDLGSPQPGDIAQQLDYIKWYFYTGHGHLEQQAAELHRELRFETLIESFVALSTEDQQALTHLRGELAVVGQHSGDSMLDRAKELNGQVETIVAPYRSRDVRDRYYAFLTEHLATSEQAQRLARETSPHRMEQFGRALENRAVVRRTASREFEKKWNDDVTEIGSQKWLESRISEVTSNLRRCAESSDSTAAHQKAFLTVVLKRLRGNYRLRSRNHTGAVNAVRDMLEKH
jgi:hypothetical protein